MTSQALQAQRFVKIINQQLDVLKEERNTVTMAVEECINQVQSEVDAWVNEGHVNQTTCAKMSNRIQQVITLLIEKSVELSGKQIDENKSDLNKTCLTTTNNLTSPGAKSIVDRAKTEPFPAVEYDASPNLTMRFAILEEAVYSLKKTTENVDDKIENVEKILKDVSTQQENDHKKMEILTNAKLKSEKKLKNKIKDLEKRYQDIKSNVDDLVETVTNVDDKLNRLEDENKSANVSMNTLYKQISSVKTFSKDALMSIQDVSKSVESTNQHYNEMSNKMNQLEISINLISSQYTEQFENMSSRNKDKTEELIGMVCQLLAKRLTAYEKICETLNKRVNSGKKKFSKEGAVENRVAEMTKRIAQIELMCKLPKVGFFSWKTQHVDEGLCQLTSFDHVDVNHGGHFDPSTGIFTAPLSGLHLITIITESLYNNKANTIVCYQKCKDKSKADVLLSVVSINQTLTRCVEIAAGDKVYLEWLTTDNPCMSINFACYMIQT